MALRTRLGELLLVVVPLILTFSLCEMYARGQVPKSGVTPARTAEIPGLTHQLKRSFSTLYHGNQIQTNDDGFRDSEFRSAETGIPRIALLGDSVTFGHVPDGDTLDSLLEEEFKKHGLDADVLNFGVPGYDANDISIVLDKQAVNYEPAIIAYVFYYNDIPPNQPTGARKVDAQHQVDLLSTFPLRSAFLEWLGRNTKALGRALGVAFADGYVAEQLNNWTDGGRDRLREAMMKLKQVSGASGACLFVANAPNLIARDQNPFQAIEDGAMELAEELGISGIDLRDGFPKSSNLSKLTVGTFDNHPDAQANAYMAAYLAESLLSSPCGEKLRVATLPQ